MKNSDNKKVIPMFKHDNTSATVMSVAESFEMKRGGKLDHLDMAYETWGKLNENKTNVIVIFTGLSPSSHIASSDKDSAWAKEFFTLL